MKKVLLIILLPLGCFSQTTLYFSATTAGQVTPNNFSTTWNVTTGATVKKIANTKDGSTLTSVTTAQVGAASPRFVLNTQFVSEKLNPITIDFSISGLTINCRGNISSTASGSAGIPVYIIRKCASDGTSSTDLFEMDEGSSWSTTLTNRTTFLAFGTATINQDERLIIEVGWKYTAGSNTSRTGTQNFGSSSASDLPDDDVSTAANNPVAKFVSTLSFNVTAPTSKPLSLLGVGGEPEPAPQPEPIQLIEKALYHIPKEFII